MTLQNYPSFPFPMEELSAYAAFTLPPIHSSLTLVQLPLPHPTKSAPEKLTNDFQVIKSNGVLTFLKLIWPLSSIWNNWNFLLKCSFPLQMLSLVSLAPVASAFIPLWWFLLCSLEMLMSSARCWALLSCLVCSPLLFFSLLSLLK